MFFSYSSLFSRVLTYSGNFVFNPSSVLPGQSVLRDDDWLLIRSAVGKLFSIRTGGALYIDPSTRYAVNPDGSVSMFAQNSIRIDSDSNFLVLGNAPVLLVGSINSSFGIGNGRVFRIGGKKYLAVYRAAVSGVNHYYMLPCGDDIK